MEIIIFLNCCKKGDKKIPERYRQNTQIVI